MYGKADGNAALARRLYQERYPKRQCLDRKTFVRLHYRLCEYGKFNSPGLGSGRPRTTTPEVQEEILGAVNMTPSISTRRVALQVDFYLWGHLKSLVYSSPVPDLECLRNRIVACSEDIRNTPGVWDRVRRSISRSRLIVDQPLVEGTYIIFGNVAAVRAVLCREDLRTTFVSIATTRLKLLHTSWDPVRMAKVCETLDTTKLCIVGPYHHGMARPQVAARGDGLQIWRVGANILNKQPWPADKGGFPAWGLGEGLTTHHVKKQLVTKPHSKAQMVGLCEGSKEPLDSLKVNKKSLSLPTSGQAGGRTDGRTDGWTDREQELYYETKKNQCPHEMPKRMKD
ncbi:hypothetical protein ANN_21963 [Periplaneta americana]|uniref:DUF4817 domain-containing protein n=1 Tax=Periplaneta americana TaxID=6978 RepID=A0ABQ8S6T5_PERAM|nr:hypothetical protein ANN_21963 [Periplaneta americana]